MEMYLYLIEWLSQTYPDVWNDFWTHLDELEEE